MARPASKEALAEHFFGLLDLLPHGKLLDSLWDFLQECDMENPRDLQALVYHLVRRRLTGEMSIDRPLTLRDRHRRGLRDRPPLPHCPARASALAGPFLPKEGNMKLKDPERWQKTVDNNQDGYGSGVIRYAERWAGRMEEKMAEGKPLAEIAKSASNEADTEGITGFMYGCAVSILAQVWEHGEELRRWHNLDTQIGTEGERANESGGTLNPALLTIG
jgi:hypothetical protein